MENITFNDIINTLLFVYGIAIFASYIITALLSVLELSKYHSKNRRYDFNALLNFSTLPSVSIIAPAYNEEKTLIQNINGLLNIKYQDFEIIIVNDGSKDNSMEVIVNYFDLVKTNLMYEMTIPSKNVRGIYKSRNRAFNHLTVIDKENGGKADALNTGVNFSQKELFLAMDVDCIIEPDALLKMVKPFIEESNIEVIASGGVIRVANSCEITDGRINKVNFPDNIWARFQVLEYFRAFTLGRMAWSKINGLLIISGAFGLFDRKRAIKVGGYDPTTVGEDLELVVRMRRYMHEVEKKKYKVAFIPDPLCWTEVPESYKILSRQRNRWTRGAIETIQRHKKMFFNPRYGLIGMVSFPYWVFFEWLAPVIQFLGFGYVILITVLGLLNTSVFITMTLFVISFALMYSFFGIFYEAYTYNKYNGISYLSKAFYTAFLETFFYQPLNMYFAITGNYDAFLSKKKKGWGEMTRKGFDKKTT